MTIFSTQSWPVYSPGKFPIGMHGSRVRRAWLWLCDHGDSIKNGVPYVCFSCHTWSSNGPFHRFSPFQRFHSGYRASRMDRGSCSCDGGSERYSFRKRQPAKSLQLGKKQAVFEHAEWTYRYTTYRWWVPKERFFELRSAVVSIPTTTANSFSLAPYDGCQDTEHTETNCRVFGA